MSAPPSESPRRPLYEDCVHCGFCLPVCPTWVSWSEEMDSPRGRIDLMRGLAEGQIDWSAPVAKHFDRCLGCLACVTACPSGVRYDVLIEQTRAERERRLPRRGPDGLFREVLFAFLPYPERLRWLAAAGKIYEWTGLRGGVLSRILPRRLRALESLMPASPKGGAGFDLPVRVPAAGKRRARVGLLAGCVQRVFFPEVNASTLRVLAAEGCEVIVPGDQGCCGALSIHAGREEESLAFARNLIAAFEGEELDAIVVNAAGCGSHLKDFGRLFATDPAWAGRAAAFAGRVRDVTEFLAALPPVAVRHPIEARVAYHDACHLAHGQGIHQAPRDLLRQIPGLTLAEIAGAEQCCGSAGIYNVVHTDLSMKLLEKKMENVNRTRATRIVTANPGCMLQLRRAGIDARHPAELLAEALE